MIVHVERLLPDGTISNFCISAHDKKEADIKIQEMNYESDYVYKITGYELDGSF